MRTNQAQVTRRGLLVASSASALGGSVLAACTPGEGPRPSPSASSGSTSAGESTAIEWSTRDVVLYGHSITVEVGPVVRTGEDVSLLPIRVTRAADDPRADALALSAYWNGPTPLHSAASGVRLIDAASATVWCSTTLGNDLLAVEPGQKIVVLPPFGGIDAESVTAFVPSVGFFDVAVVDLEEVAAQLKDLDLEGELSTIEPEPRWAPGLPLESYVEAVDHASDERTTKESVVVNISSDITFATDSAELSAAADEILISLADKLKAHPEGGTLTIVGHTDDVADEAYNQDLSQRRAQVVSDRLAELTDVTAWETQVTGKGETEPRVEGTHAQARAANRRVEIVISPKGGVGELPAPQDAELPAPEGTSGPGPDGVRVTGSGSGAGEIVVLLEHVARRDGYLFAELSIAAESGAILLGLGWLERQGAALTAAAGLGLLVGRQRIYPVEYVLDDQRRALTEQRLTKLPEGMQASVGVVWPDTGQDTVVVDVPGILGSHPPFRLTDVPVVE